jgi:hypothetical protein
MDAQSQRQTERERARQAIERFVQRFDGSYRLLARHASLPLVLTLELLNYINNQFLRGQVPWVAEVDLLLSDLCIQVGYEQFAMDTHVRGVLLDELRQEAGTAQMQAIARLVIQYVYQLPQTNAAIPEHERQAQEWAAMVYLDEHRPKAVAQILDAFKRCAVPASAGVGTESIVVVRSEMDRLARITGTLAPELKQYKALVRYATDVSRQIANPTKVGGHARRPRGLDRTRRVMNVELPAPEVLSHQSANQYHELQPESISADDQAEIDHYLELLEAHRNALMSCLIEQAKLGVFTPVAIINHIADARDNIRRIKRALFSWGVVFQDLPDDNSDAMIGIQADNEQEESIRVFSSQRDEEIDQQQKLLVIYRRNLQYYLQQQATLGSMLTPPQISNDIHEARNKIYEIKDTLRGWGVVVQDHPDDEPYISSPPQDLERYSKALEEYGALTLESLQERKKPSRNISLKEYQKLIRGISIYLSLCQSIYIDVDYIMEVKEIMRDLFVYFGKNEMTLSLKNSILDTLKETDKIISFIRNEFNKTRSGDFAMAIREYSSTIWSIYHLIDIEQATRIDLFSFSKKDYNSQGSIHIDWVDYFNPTLPTQNIWDTILFPTLKDLKQRLVQDENRLIILQARAHLSIGLAFGYIFRATTGFQIRIEQGPTEWWQTDDLPAGDTPLVVERVLSDPTRTDATIELCIAQDVGTAVAAYIKEQKLPIRERIRMIIPENPGRVRDGQHAMAIAHQVRSEIMAMRIASPGQMIHLFGAMPFGLAVLIGTQLNAYEPIQYYEYKSSENAYQPSCRLEE